MKAMKCRGGCGRVDDIHDSAISWICGICANEADYCDKCGEDVRMGKTHECSNDFGTANWTPPPQLDRIETMLHDAATHSKIIAEQRNRIEQKLDMLLDAEGICHVCMEPGRCTCDP